VVQAFLRDRLDGRLTDDIERAEWSELESAHRRNENAEARCVGLVLETRPDHVDPKEVERLRRLGATKIQIGIQSLDDEILRRNGRGHDVPSSRKAMVMLRSAGFKLHIHWMPNLLGAEPADDAADFVRLFDDPAIRPDELKIYPCSLIETAELMVHYRSGAWKPYGHDELAELLEGCMLQVPEYCRVTRVIRDIPGDEIVDGNKTTNFRQVVEQRLEKKGLRSRDIRAREIRRGRLDAEGLELAAKVYDTPGSREVFLQIVTSDDRLAGFCRLSLPSAPSAIDEVSGCAMIREVHVYGSVSAIGDDPDDALGGRSQHRGLGRRLVEEGARRAAEAGFGRLAVISAIGTREYYRKLGFEDGRLYQVRR
ncbi:MAG: radical SAM protein, partial [Acidobacteriota bacterium]